MFQRFVSFGVGQLFAGARRGQPLVAAFGTAISIWGLFRRFSRDDKLIYKRKLRPGETLRIRMYRGEAAVEQNPPEL